MTRYALALGSNVGDRWQYLVEAHQGLSQQFDMVATSSIFETAPVGGPDQDPFLNAVVVVEADLDAHQVLEICQEIEQAHGRRRTERWGPRTIDIDIVASDGVTVSDDRLVVPHARVAEREFVLRPLVEVWPEAPVGDGMTAQAALDVVGNQDVDHLARNWVPPISPWPGNTLVGAQLVMLIAIASSFAYDGGFPEGEVSAIRIVGTAIAFVGLVVAFIASRRLGPALTPSPEPRPGTTLVISGPYRYARHPIYGGIVLFLLGTALLLDSVIGFVGSLLLVPFFLFKASYEERRLRMRFAGYRAYMAVVTRRLIPFVV